MGFVPKPSAGAVCGWAAEHQAVDGMRLHIANFPTTPGAGFAEVGKAGCALALPATPDQASSHRSPGAQRSTRAWLLRPQSGSQWAGAFRDLLALAPHFQPLRTKPLA